MVVPVNLRWLMAVLTVRMTTKSDRARIFCISSATNTSMGWYHGKM